MKRLPSSRHLAYRHLAVAVSLAALVVLITGCPPSGPPRDAEPSSPSTTSADEDSTPDGAKTGDNGTPVDDDNQAGSPSTADGDEAGDAPAAPDSDPDQPDPDQTTPDQTADDDGGLPPEAPLPNELAAGQTGDGSADNGPGGDDSASADTDRADADPDDATPGADFPMPDNVDPNWEMGPSESTKPWDLGEPLVENAEKLTRLDPKAAIWVDAENKRLVMMGRVVLREAPLEMFACLRNSKEHESIVALDVFDEQAYKIHAGLLAIGAESGHSVRWDPVYEPASGDEIGVEVRYKDQEGNLKQVPAQQWITNHRTGKTMDYPWVFAGSGFWEDARTGKRHYQAAGGDIICVSNFTTAILDLPIQSSQSNDALLFRANTEAIPAAGTPVTLVLTVEKKLEDGQPGE